LTYEQLVSLVGGYVARDATMARLAQLVELDPPDEPHTAATAEQVLRETSEALCSWLVDRSVTGPIVLIIDDVQWIDPTSIELLVQLKQRARGLFVVLAQRAGDQMAWCTALCDVVVELRPLDAEDAARLIGCVTSADEAHVRVAALRSDGIPLFAEELGRMLERGELAELGSIPNSLHDLVLSRLDSVPEAKKLAQVGASIGRQVDLDLLAEVCGLTLDQAIEQSHLLAAALIWEQSDLAGQSTFGFRHALIQDAAYDSQLRERKHAVHGRVAEVLRSRDVGSTPVGLATIAHHLESAGPTRRVEAVAGWAAAGFGTADAGAHVEAIGHFTRGLALIGDLTDPAESLPAELQLQLGLGASLSTTEGYGQERVRAAFTRAQDLCAPLGGPPELFPAIWGMWTFFLVRGEYETAQGLAGTLAEIARSEGDPALQIESDTAVGITSFYLGQLTLAAEHLSAAASRYERSPVVTPFQRFQQPAVAALSHLALVQWLMGHDDATCRATGARAVALSASCEVHLRWFAEEYAQTFCAALGALAGDAPYCLEHAQKAIDVCTEHGSLMFLAGAEIYKGHAQVQLGDVEAGLARLEAACESYHLTGARLFRPYHLTRLALARSAAGDESGAHDVLCQAVELAEEIGEKVHVAETLRLRGEAERRLRPDDPGAAGDDLARALTVARSIGAARLEAQLEAALGAVNVRLGVG
jgi:predicted ATPase